MPMLLDEDAPESLSLQDSKRTIRRQAANLLKFEASEKEKQRARNRQRDKRLKEQAEIPKKRRKDAQARMERAMLDAAEEGREGEGSSEHEDQEDVDKDSSDGGSQDEDIEEDEDEQMGSDDPSDQEDDTKRNPDYLPDHLFVSAFSKPTATSKTISQSSAQAKLPRKASKRRLRSAKDIVVGYVPCTMSYLRKTKSKLSTSPRTLQILPDPAKTFPSAAATVPRGKVKAFVERSLGLRGIAPKSKGWTRKPGSHIR